MRDCRGQLLQHVRRGLASDQERTAFEAHLGTCETCRVMLEIADDFDRVGVADPEDAERIARIASKARRVYERPSAVGVRFRSSRRLAWPLAAAAVVIAGAAVAGGWGPLRSEELEVAPVETRAPEPPPARVAPPAPRPVAPPQPTAEATTPPPKPVIRVPKRVVVAPPATAEELYRSANEARRGGQTARAVARYRKLQRQFPGSGEARLSHVSLGRLLLQRGSAGAAVAQFDAYLAGGSGQRLAAEALFGRGRALQALGRRVEEAQNWKRLIGQYPDSAYADHANRRLEGLR
jgi:TolA-binding protein